MFPSVFPDGTRKAIPTLVASKWPRKQGHYNQLVAGNHDSVHARLCSIVRFRFPVAVGVFCMLFLSSCASRPYRMPDPFQGFQPEQNPKQDAIVGMWFSQGIIGKGVALPHISLLLSKDGYGIWRSYSKEPKISSRLHLGWITYGVGYLLEESVAKRNNEMVTQSNVRWNYNEGGVWTLNFFDAESEHKYKTLVLGESTKNKRLSSARNSCAVRVAGGRLLISGTGPDGIPFQRPFDAAEKSN